MIKPEAYADPRFVGTVDDIVIVADVPGMPAAPDFIDHSRTARGEVLPPPPAETTPDPKFIKFTRWTNQLRRERTRASERTSRRTTPCASLPGNPYGA